MIIIIIIIICKAIIVTGELFEFILFLQKYSYVTWYLILLSVLGSIGQVRFVYLVRLR